MNLAQKVCEHVNALPEPAVQEVLDFVEFLILSCIQNNTNI
jgi:hypothetical protein